jgi:hypothetical protein
MMEEAAVFLLAATVLLVAAFTVANTYRLSYLLVPQLRARKKAREVAIGACRKLLPDEPVCGAGICADEPDRYVVRVFYGNRYVSPTTSRLPPWRGYLIVAVRKDTYVDEVINDERYCPTIR